VLQLPPEDLATAFARNIVWLASVYPVIPRHLIFVGLDVSGFGYRELAAERRIGGLMALPAARASSN
jgi:hypothetical protein